MRRNFTLIALLTSVPFGWAHETEVSRYNYRDDIRPIFVEHCGGCHRAGGVGPMSLLEYQEAVPWANAIKMQLLLQTMPPWLPADGMGVAPWRHERSLTAEEVDTIVDWVVGQTPEGEPFEASALESGDATASPGHGPDLVLEAEAPVVLTQDEFEKVACVVYPVGLGEARTASAFIIEPELATVLRRATIYRGGSCEDAVPLATWLPDQDAAELPKGTGVSLASQDSLAVQLSYVKGWEDDGKRLEDRTRIGVIFADDAELSELVPIKGSSYTVDANKSLLAVYAEPPVTGEGEEAPAPELRVEAVLPDGQHRPLLVIESYNPAWREKYVLETPMALPAGSELRVSGPGVWVDLLGAGDPRASGS